MENHIEYNGIILSVISQTSRVRFDLTKNRVWIFRIVKGVEDLFPVASRYYAHEKLLSYDLRAICKAAKIACPKEFQTK